MSLHQGPPPLRWLRTIPLFKTTPENHTAEVAENDSAVHGHTRNHQNSSTIMVLLPLSYREKFSSLTAEVVENELVVLVRSHSGHVLSCFCLPWCRLRRGREDQRQCATATTDR